MATETDINSESLSQQFTSSHLSGWGRYPRISGRIYSPNSMLALSSCLPESDKEGLIARGLGRSYGDAALSASSRIILTEKLNRILAFDYQTGRLCCEPGLSYAEIIDTFLPQGWFPTVTPGSKYVTMGGALASDIHGKNHDKDGSFVDSVNSFKLLTAERQSLNCSRQENSELFWATTGGMGLTGFISEIVISLRPVENQYMVVKKIKCANLAETFKTIENNQENFQYSVSWIDGLSGGDNLGRSILMLGRHARDSELSPRTNALATAKAKPILTVPTDMPSWTLNRYSLGAFNSLFYHLSAGDGKEQISHFEPFFYPLDSIADWNRLYGKAGFVQYQCVLPLSSSKAGIEEILTLSSKRGRSSFLAVLKKFGSGHGFLSFPMEGYTLALDMAVKPGLCEFTQELDNLVIKYGGRVYLAKDACLNPKSFRNMYTDLAKWSALKKSIDPNNSFNSALSERLKI